MQKKSMYAPALLWKRFLAFLIDVVILDFVVFAPFSGAIKELLPVGNFHAMQEFFAANASLTSKLTLLLFFLGIIALLYFSILEYRIQQTAGKILFKLHVVSQSNELKFWQCLVRSLFIIPVFPFVLLWIIDPITMLFTQNNQRLLERLSQTATVELIYPKAFTVGA
ncbi:RDD family protein [Candidatus Woesearchaeota archaeon]|nr:RDD family protein [Candidatus Woesearchaeota archaeon]